MSTLDPYGLRRRSPNPNSPIPYSPALLSPYIPSTYQWTDPSTRNLTEERTPTIRLVNPREEEEDYRYAPPPIRTRSDDRDVRPSTIASSVSNLRRHGTDPKSYPALSPFSNRYDDVEGKRYRERPVPPLPLNVDKSANASSSTKGDRRWERSSRPPSLMGGEVYPDSPGKSSVVTGKSLVDSLKSLANPFTTTRGRRHSSTLSDDMRDGRGSDRNPYLTEYKLRASTPTSFGNRGMERSSSMDSQATLTVPFHPNKFWKGYTGSNVSLNSLGSANGIKGLTDKFPQNGVGKKRDRWTGYKIVLLLSVFVVSHPFMCGSRCLPKLIGYGFAGLAWALSISLRGMLLTVYVHLWQYGTIATSRWFQIQI